MSTISICLLDSLKEEFDERAACRNESRIYQPDAALIALSAKLPDMLRVPNGAVSDDTFRVCAENGDY